MSYKFTCPYCFKEMWDNQVLFRSEYVSSRNASILPDGYDDIEDFLARYRGEDRERILAEQQTWEFFAERADPVYEQFWANYDGTTENNPADKKLGVAAYRRPILDPNKAEHQRYLKRQPDGGYLIRENNMVTQIELRTGEKCQRRVCPHCHNPIPQNYGKTAAKFVPVIGITGAGKTVYLAQLLKDMGDYVGKVGLTANGKALGTGVINFLAANKVKEGVPLPGSTPRAQFQQPLFYQLTRDLGGSRKRVETLVLYDVAGEVFEAPELVDRFAPFVKHADGAIVLITPLQFKAIQDVAIDEKALDEPSTVLQVIQNIITHGDTERKCETPFAVCMSKADTEEVQAVLSDELGRLLLEDVKGDQDEDGIYRPVFNAKEYNPILKELNVFIQNKASELAGQLRANYSNYAYFAFTALGCRVNQVEENGEGLQIPEGPVRAARIEEPLLWLMHQLDYIGVNEPIRYPGRKYIECPNCKSIDTEACDITVRTGFFHTVHHNRKCNQCRHTWIRDAE